MSADKYRNEYRSTVRNVLSYYFGGTSDAQKVEKAVNEIVSALTELRAMEVKVAKAEGYENAMNSFKHSLIFDVSGNTVRLPEREV